MDKTIIVLAGYTLAVILFAIAAEIERIGRSVRITTPVTVMAIILLAPCLALPLLVIIRKHHTN